MSTNAAHDRWWQISEVVFGVPLLAAIALQLVVPPPSPGVLPAPAVVAGGIGLFVVGVALIVLARREFARYGQPTDPGRPTGRVVTSGIFSVSRNPLYLGCVCVLAGIGLAVNLIWMLILLLPAAVACHYVLIAPEERYLAARFGDEYRAYTAAVHRWFGRAH
jgi:protein-S-isoprenylcysteine O-methyltransferase Ste14